MRKLKIFILVIILAIGIRQEISANEPISTMESRFITMAPSCNTGAVTGTTQGARKIRQEALEARRDTASAQSTRL